MGLSTSEVKIKLCFMCSNQPETGNNYCDTCLRDTFRRMVIKVYEAVGLRSDVCREINELNARIVKYEDLLTKSYWLADKVLFNLAINHKNKMPWQVDKIADLKEELSKYLTDCNSKGE